MNMRSINMQEDWERVFSVIDESITIHDEGFNIVHANSAARRLLNLPESGDVRMKCYKAYHGLEELPSSCPFFREATFSDPTTFETYEPFLDKQLGIKAVPRFDANDNFIGTVHVVREIPKPGDAYSRLIHQEQLLRKALEIAKMGTWEWDVLTNDVYWTGEIYKIYGYDPETFSPDYKTVTDAMHPESLDYFLESIDAALNRNEPFEMDYRLIRTDGQVRTIHTKGEVIFDRDGRPLKMFGTVYDITDRMESNRRFRESEDRFRSIFEHASDGILIADVEDKAFVQANNAICNMLGHAREELLSLNVADMHPEPDLPRIVDLFERQARGEISLAGDIPMLRKDGTVIHVDINADRMNLGGRECMVGFFRDITERKEIENKINASLKEKETLLKEIHHRVKNNMAIVSSLLRLQSRFSGDAEIRRILEDSRNRINSMALVHESLYESESLSCINVNNYIRELAGHLLEVYTMKDIRLKHRLDEVNLEIDHIIPLGLIINELLTNSIKHAFDGDGPHVVEISLSMDREGVSLTYRDNGPGLPEGLDLQNVRSLGLQIIHMLSRQLKGSIELDQTDRSSYTLSFPVTGGE